MYILINANEGPLKYRLELRDTEKLFVNFLFSSSTRDFPNVSLFAQFADSCMQCCVKWVVNEATPSCTERTGAVVSEAVVLWCCSFDAVVL